MSSINNFILFEMFIVAPIRVCYEQTKTERHPVGKTVAPVLVRTGKRGCIPLFTTEYKRRTITPVFTATVCSRLFG